MAEDCIFCRIIKDMYYTGLDPRTMKPVYVPTNPHEKAMQRALIQYRRPENRPLVEEALRLAGRTDLIGYGPKCLLRPEKGQGTGDLARKAGGSKTGDGSKKAKPKKTIRNVHKKSVKK